MSTHARFAAPMTLFSGICLCAACSNLRQPTAASESTAWDSIAAQQTAKPTYRVQFVDNADIRLDGRTDEAAWRRATPQSRFFFPWKQQPAPRTTFRALCDTQYFYFDFDVADSDIVLFEPFKDKRDALLEDRVEMFLSRDEQMSDYYCFEIDPLGRPLDYRARWPQHLDMSWDWKGLECRGRLTEGGYNVEGRISLASFESLGFVRWAPGARVPCGIYRAEFSHPAMTRPQETEAAQRTKQVAPERAMPNEDWISWVDPGTRSPDFHRPSSLGWLIIQR